MSSDGKDNKYAGRRLLIVANRHPITVKRTTDGQYTYNISSGGLVTGLSGLPPSLKDSSVYYGWPGIDIPADKVKEVEAGMADKGGVPLWIDGKLMDLHYNGYSSKCFQNYEVNYAVLTLSCRLHRLAVVPLSRQ